MNKAAKVLLAALTILYPCVVFVGLVYFKTSPRLLSLCVTVAILSNFLAATGNKNPSGRLPAGKIILAAALGVLVIVILATNSERVLKFYPVIMNVTLLGTFGATLFRPPSMILRFACLQDGKLGDNPAIVRYCVRVTMVWCCFFVFNMGMAFYTALFASSLTWSLYNGLISYILMGILFLGEMVVRRFIQNK